MPPQARRSIRCFLPSLDPKFSQSHPKERPCASNFRPMASLITPHILCHIFVAGNTQQQARHKITPSKHRRAGWPGDAPSGATRCLRRPRLQNQLFVILRDTSQEITGSVKPALRWSWLHARRATIVLPSVINPSQLRRRRLSGGAGRVLAPRAPPRTSPDFRTLGSDPERRPGCPKN